MRTTIMPNPGPVPRRVRVEMPLDSDLLGRLIPVIDPDLYAPGLLPGESAREREARLEAARDITDDLVVEQAALLATEVIAYTPAFESSGSAA
ncbi:hypothetical protein HFP72_05955 [Nocardiopsis sp. ARC36]